jgi:hypothetical protein
MKKLSYFILILSYCFSLKAEEQKQPEIHNIGEIGCSIGTGLVFLNLECSGSAYLYPDITLGLKIEESDTLMFSGYSPSRISLQTILTLYPFKGSFYTEFGLGAYYTAPYVYLKTKHPSTYDLAIGFHLGNRWTIFDHIILGINYFGLTFPTHLLLIGVELGYRF